MYKWYHISTEARTIQIQIIPEKYAIPLHAISSGVDDQWVQPWTGTLGLYHYFVHLKMEHLIRSTLNFISQLE